jgi:hypothetical protein
MRNDHTALPASTMCAPVELDRLGAPALASAPRPAPSKGLSRAHLPLLSFMALALSVVALAAALCVRDDQKRARLIELTLPACILAIARCGLPQVLT